MHIKLKNGSKISVSKNSARAIESYFRRKGLLDDGPAVSASPRKQTPPPPPPSPVAEDAQPAAAPKKPAKRASKKTS